MTLIRNLGRHSGPSAHLSPVRRAHTGIRAGQGAMRQGMPRAPLMQGVQLAAQRRRVPPLLVCVVEHALKSSTRKADLVLTFSVRRPQ
jgi:hypothetical protein